VQGLKKELGSLCLLVSAVQVALVTASNVVSRKGIYPKSAKRKIAAMQDNVCIKVLDRVASGQISPFVSSLKTASDNFRLYSIEGVQNRTATSKWLQGLLVNILPDASLMFQYKLKSRDAFGQLSSLGRSMPVPFEFWSMICGP